MDKELMMQGIEEIQQGNFSLKGLLKYTVDLEKQAARVAAIAACVLDGTVYGDIVKSHRDYAYLMFALRAFKDLGKEMEKEAQKALKGEEDTKGKNGHAARFAEFLDEEGMKNVKFEEVGTFYTKEVTEIISPSKKNQEEYRKFIMWVNEKCREKGFESLKSPASVSWTGLQKLFATVKDDELPPGCTRKVRREVQMRSR